MKCLPLFLLLGCSESNLFAQEGATGGENDAGEDTAADAAEDTDSEDLEPAVWYTLEATLRIDAGAASLDGAEGRLVLAGAELDRRDCSYLAEGAITVGSIPAVEERIDAWWEFDISTVADCAYPGLPKRLGVGIGALDAEVRARLGTVDQEDAADRLQGAWLSNDGGVTVFPFGYAEAGSAEVADVPAADGLYALVPLLLLAIPPED